jgi:hypothetical protein
MVKALLWFLLSALTAQLAASLLLQGSAKSADKCRRETAQPSRFYVEVVAAKYRHRVTPRAAVSLATEP